MSIKEKKYYDNRMKKYYEGKNKYGNDVYCIPFKEEMTNSFISYLDGLNAKITNDYFLKCMIVIK